MRRGGRILFSSIQEWALCGVTMLWGGTFLLIRLAMRQSAPLWFVGLRFSAAAALLLLCSLPILRGLTRRELLGGGLLGFLVFLGFALQTAGLASIPATKSAFITAFYVPLVPVFELLIMRRRPGLLAWLGMGLAFPGVMLLSDISGLDSGFGYGEMATILCAIVFALEIIAIGMIAPGTNPRRLTAVEAAVAAILSFACMPILGEAPAPFSWRLICIACGLGLVTALIQSVMAWAQKNIPPTRATIIYTGEPVWAGIFGYAAGERLPFAALLGCVLIVAGILISNKKPDAPAATPQKQPDANE